MSGAPTSGAEGLPLGALVAAGWAPDDLIWEGLQTEALAALAEDRPEEAAESWAKALELARARFAANDPRRAASLANQASALLRAGEAALAGSLLEEALTVWDASASWIEAMKPERRARSSTFHLRLEQKHPGGYSHLERERRDALAREGRARIAALKAGETTGRDAAERLARWRKDCPEGFTDTRKLLAAALLIGG